LEKGRDEASRKSPQSASHLRWETGRSETAKKRKLRDKKGKRESSIDGPCQMVSRNQEFIFVSVLSYIRRQTRGLPEEKRDTGGMQTRKNNFLNVSGKKEDSFADKITLTCDFRQRKPITVERERKELA